MSTENAENFNRFPFRYALRPDIERKIIDAVKSGAVGDTRDALSEIEYPPERLWTARHMRDAQDTVITFISILSYTAIEAGVERNEASGMADRYIREVRKAKTSDSLKVLINLAALNFTLKVGNSFLLKDKPEAVKAVAAYIDDHKFEKIRAGELSKELGYSENGLSVLFRRQTGMTLTDYIHRKKVDYAAKELSGTDIRIGEIAQKYGYSNRKYFEIIFRKIRGMTPSEFRDSMRRNQF
ncbi:MAG: AraC family transcriptional regulator [Lachnospiraceae bacterium]|nr:AraC family transcriptional regulator [Lachnospiraceae bacterium]